MLIKAAETDDLESWARLRAALWPRLSAQEHLVEVEAVLLAPGKSGAFIASTDEGGVVGFAEVSVRHDYVNGCRTSPVAFLEGIFVLEEYRSQGVARHLVEAVVGWAEAKNLSELASDADLVNHASHHMHKALGFEETGRVVFFHRNLR